MTNYFLFTLADSVLSQHISTHFKFVFIWPVFATPISPSVHFVLDSPKGGLVPLCLAVQDFHSTPSDLHAFTDLPAKTVSVTASYPGSIIVRLTVVSSALVFLHK